MRAACIDIGSNTTRLLIADRDGDRLTEVHQERAFTQLGRGMQADGTIAAEKVAEVVEVVGGQLAVARAHEVDQLRGVATAAVRGAGNGAELAAAVTDVTGLTVEILSEAEEARLAFLGAALTSSAAADRPLGVVDVGGGSSEIVVGRPPDAIAWWSSVRLGSGALTERHLASDPPTVAELAAARAEVQRALAAYAPPRPDSAVAVGGSATSLCRVAGPVLDQEALDRALALLRARPAAVVALRFGIDTRRAALLPAGLLILEAGGALLGTTLRVGRGGLREGVLLEARRP